MAIVELFYPSATRKPQGLSPDGWTPHLDKQFHSEKCSAGTSRWCVSVGCYHQSNPTSSWQCSQGFLHLDHRTFPQSYLNPGDRAAVWCVNRRCHDLMNGVPISETESGELRLPKKPLSLSLNGSSHDLPLTIIALSSPSNKKGNFLLIITHFWSLQQIL